MLLFLIVDIMWFTSKIFYLQDFLQNLRRLKIEHQQNSTKSYPM